MDSILVITTLVLLAGFLFSYRKKYKNFPPGPTGYPLLGNVLSFINSKRPQQKLFELRQKYGSVIGLHFGNEPVVVLNDWISVKEALVKQSNIFAARYPMKLVEAAAGHKIIGIIDSDGPVWKEQRRFFLSNARDFGFGKTSMEDAIIDGANEVMAKIDKFLDNSMDISTLFTFPVINVLWKLIAGQRFDIDFNEDEGERFIKLMEEEFKALQIILGLSFAPSPIRKLVCLSAPFKKVKKTRQEMDTLITGTIERHINTYSVDNTRDYVDQYLKEIDALKDNGKPTSITVEHLKAQMVDFIHAGIDTVSRTLSWSMSYMAKYPAIQLMVQQELDKVIGGRNVSIRDRSRLVYTEAVLYEIQRVVTLVPLSVAYRNTEETTVQGYTIPKDTLILANLYSVHNDPALWDHPERFDPLRFIDSEGKLCKPEYLIPFSIGRRACPGEPLAKMELFLFFATILQKYQVCFSSGTPDPDLSDSVFGGVSFAPEHSVVFQKRNPNIIASKAA